MGFHDIPPESSRCLSKYSSGVFPTSRSDYRICNIGKTPVRVQMKYETWGIWSGPIGERKKLQPGEECILKLSGKAYCLTECEVSNKSHVRAIVHTSLLNEVHENPTNRVRVVSFNAHILENTVIKKIVSLVTSQLPPVGQILSTMLMSLWPAPQCSEESEGYSLDNIMKKVASQIDYNSRNLTSGILERELRCLKRKVEYLKWDMENNAPRSQIANSYMNLAEYMIGLEEKLYFAQNVNFDFTMINYHILPLYSDVVTFKLLFYQSGIVHCRKIGLSTAQVNQLKIYSKRLVQSPDGPSEYIEALTRQVMENSITHVSRMKFTVNW
ncbi:hypothetical protein JTB14_030380 [Gonioctena quinquepunctata]|nr:hypothetical protein JTB14_030380 [Gonioctena quinquepunctata]